MTAGNSSGERMGSGWAHGKAILIGEHAVVYGQPAIALPLLSITVHVTIWPAGDEDALDCAYYRGPLRQAPSNLSGLRTLIEETRRALPPQYRAMAVAIATTIPPGYGLGSSAAVAVGVVRALYDWHQRPLMEEQLLALVHVAESHAHGTPSGVDAWAASSDRPLWFIRGHQPEVIPLSRPLFLVVANSDSPGSTRDAVRQVRESRDHVVRRLGPIERIGELTQALKPALVSGDYDYVGVLLTEAHRQLADLHITTAHVDSLVSAAIRSGALGAKLTGGGAGGSIVALAADRAQQLKLAEALTHAGAPQVWTPVLGEGN